MSSVLKLNQLAHRYKEDWIYQNLSLEVHQGEWIALLGASGCGKTTLLRSIAGLISPSRGAIFLDGKEITDLPPAKREIGLVFQDYALFPHMTVAANIAFGLPKSERNSGEKVKKALEEMHLGHVADRYPHTLSGGQQQRIALLRALAPNPRVMLLDEPFSGLDQHLRQRVRQETLSMLSNSGAATLIVTHDPEEAMYLADRIVVLNNNAVVQDAVPSELYSNPADPFIARLFGPVNSFDAQVENGTVATPLGTFGTPQYENGAQVKVMIRASDVALKCSDEQGAKVVSARPLGPDVEVTLALRDASPTIVSLVPALQAPKSGEFATIHIANENVFVFAA